MKSKKQRISLKTSNVKGTDAAVGIVLHRVFCGEAKPKWNEVVDLCGIVFISPNEESLFKEKRLIVQFLGNRANLSFKNQKHFRQ